MATDPPSSPGPAPTFNLDEALQRVDGDRDLLAEIAGIFLSNAPAMVADVLAAVNAGDAAQVSRAVHRLKGSILTFGAPGAAGAALTLEAKAHAGDLSTAHAEVERLSAEVDRLRQGLEELVREHAKRTA